MSATMTPELLTLSALESLVVFRDQLHAIGEDPHGDLVLLAFARLRQIEQRPLAPVHQNAVRALDALEEDWYAALQRGAPRYEVYADRRYLAESWACWQAYSRRYLRAILPRIDARRSWTVLDLGCGIGFSTSAFARALPHATVIGTNIRDTPQWRANEWLAQRDGWRVEEELTDVAPRALVFASEYFEHFQRPVDHLREILRLRPSVLYVANTFGQPSIGHFPFYGVDGLSCDGRATSRRCGAELRRQGYQKVKLGIWNERPSCWIDTRHGVI